MAIEMKILFGLMLLMLGFWSAAKDLKLNDRLRDVNGNEIMVETIVRVEGKTPVYNLHIEHDWHTYFANGILTHNKLDKLPTLAPDGMMPDESTSGVSRSVDGARESAGAADNKRVVIYGSVS